MSDISNLSLEFLTNSPFMGWSALIVLLALSVYHYRKTNPPLPAKYKYPLLALRSIALLALFLTLLEPVISYSLNGERRQRMTIALDVSGSMRQTIDGVSRLQSVDSVFAAGDNILARLSQNYEIDWRYFADSLTVSREKPNSENDASGLGNSTRGTAIGEALAEMSQANIENPADVWLLISDGINNIGREPTQIADKLLAPLQIPIFTVGVGERSADFDVEIADITYNPVAYVGAESPIKISLRWRGVGETTLEAQVELHEVGPAGESDSRKTASASQRVKLGRGELTAEVELKYIPTKPGAVFLRATISTTTAESRTENNSRIFAIQALKSRLKVALVSEDLNWDFKFLKEALKKNERVEVVDIIEKKFDRYLGDKFPSSQGALNEFDVVVLLNPSAIRPDNRYRLLQSYVSQHGGGLFVLAGERLLGKNQGASEAAGTVALTNLLPLRIASGYRNILHRTTSISLRGENILHPALRITEENENVREVWRSFPPFQTVAPFTEVNSDSGETVVLAESEYQIASPLPKPLSATGFKVRNDSTPIDPATTKPIALIAAQKRGAGKVLELNGSPIWRMAFQSVATEQTARHFSEFVNGAINWLSVSEDISPVKIEPERVIYSRGEVAVFSGSAFDQSYRALDGFSGDVFLYGSTSDNQGKSDTLVATLQSAGEGVYRAEFEGLTPGAYRFEGRSFVDGELFKTDTGRIQVTQYSLEQRETTPNFAALQAISQSAGGKYAHISRLDEIEQALVGATLNVSEEKEIPLRGDWRILAVFIIALSVEWFLRKRLQLL